MPNTTKQALEESLKHMLLKKPLDKITIRDITEDCGISRMAFYYHFQDIYDLVEWACAEDVARAAAQAAYEKSSEKTDFSKKMDSVWEYLKKLFRLSLDTKFIATRRDAIILNIPILIPIIALFAWGATIWLMLIGLFFGMRYRIDSDGDVPGSINNLMDHAADAADDIKHNLNDDK